MVATFCPEKTPPTEWNWEGLFVDFGGHFNFAAELPEETASGVTQESLGESLRTQVARQLEARTEEFGAPVMEHRMKVLLLQTIDDQWKDHLLSIDHLKEGIGMRAYGQRNSKEEYKREAYGLFMEMMGRIRHEVVNKLFRVQLAREEEVTRMEEEQRRQRNALTRLAGPAPAVQAPARRDAASVGRNDPCPCGSGNKYKKCCGQ